MREAMFDKATAGKNLLNPSCTIYQEIARIAQVMRSNEPLRFGRMYYRQISGDGQHFGFPFGTTYTLAFSRLLYGEETLICSNISGNARNDCVIVDSTLHADGSTMKFLYGGAGTIPVNTAADGSRFVRVNLPGYGFAILA
jgi:hypothetical protein